MSNRVWRLFENDDGMKSRILRVGDNIIYITNPVEMMSRAEATGKAGAYMHLLVKHSAKQGPKAAQNVKNLIQDVIDGKISEEDFACGLQREVNGLRNTAIPLFIKKTLAPLRHCLVRGWFKIPGINPPPHPLGTDVPPSTKSPLVPEYPLRPLGSIKEEPEESQVARAKKTGTSTARAMT